MKELSIQNGSFVVITSPGSLFNGYKAKVISIARLYPGYIVVLEDCPSFTNPQFYGKDEVELIPAI